MKTGLAILIVAFIVVAAFLLGVLCYSRALQKSSRRSRQRSTKTSAGRRCAADAASETKKPKMETTKKVIWACLINGFAWVWCSYVLAYLDRVQIAESLSQVAVTEIIGVVLSYCIKSAVENLSKNNNWPDKAATGQTEQPIPPADDSQSVG